MSILKYNLRLSGSAVQSGARSTNSKVNNRVCATFLAGLILFGGGAKAQNVLVNPGAEAGDLTGWNVSLTGYIYAVSTNALIDGAGSGNTLAQSGSHTFQLFDTTGGELAPTASIYQDFAADPGSQWSASCYAICYASNYFSTAIAYMSVAFYDISNNVLGDTNFVSVPYGVHGSVILDPKPGDSVPGIIIVPPPATDASGWLFLQATNFYYGYTAPPGSLVNPPPGPGIESSAGASFVSTNLTAPPGTAFVRYQLEYDNSADAGGAVYWDDCVLQKLVGSDPDITNPPVAVTVYASGAASFTVGDSHAYVGEKVTYQWQKDGTNLPPAGGVNDIAGKTTLQTLSFTNCQAADAGMYDVVVTDINTHNTPPITNSIRSVPVPLTVLTLSPLQKVNVLGVNSGFENAPIWVPWEIFNGCYFATTNNVYGSSTIPVNVYDGNEVALIGANGDRDNGFHHAFPAAPGTWWKAGGWAYISSSNDFTAGNTCRLQIWFRDASGIAVPATSTYESFKLYGLAYTNADMQYTNIDTSSSNYGQVGYHAQLPRDQWVYLPVSNVVNNAGIGLGDDIPWNTLPGSIFMVPTNTTPPTAQINFQVYEYCPQTTDVPTPEYLGNATDAAYWDDMELIQVVPVTNLTASVSGNNVNLSFSAGAGLDYTVLYKTNLTDATWSVLTDVSAPWSWQTNVLSIGISTNITVSDPITAHSRFYRLQVH